MKETDAVDHDKQNNNDDNNNNNTVIKGRVYYYCRLQNDTNAIFSKSAPSSFAPSYVAMPPRLERDHHDDTATNHDHKKRKRVSGKDSLSSSFHLDEPVVGWIFEVALFGSNNEHILSSYLKQNYDRIYDTTTTGNHDSNINNKNKNSNGHINHSLSSSEYFYSLLCVPQSWEFVLWQACTNQSIISIPYCVIVPIQQRQLPLPAVQPQPSRRLSAINGTSISISSMMILPCAASASTYTMHDTTTTMPLRTKTNNSTDHDDITTKNLLYTSSNTIGRDHSDIWTLEQLARYETLDVTDTNVTTTASTVTDAVPIIKCQSSLSSSSNPQTLKKEKPKKRFYSLIGRVTTISPILSVHGKDPFVLMEIVHVENSTDNNHSTSVVAGTTTTTIGATDEANVDDEVVALQFHCVVVLRKHGLSCHSSIVPNDTIVVLHQVRKQRWRIPDLFVVSSTIQSNSQNHHESSTTTTTIIPPSSIFVVDSPYQMTVFYTSTRATDTDTQFPLGSRSLPSSFPATSTNTTTTTTAIAGLIRTVHYHPEIVTPGKRQRVHMLEIITNTMTPRHSQHASSNIIKLYMSHYPMSTSILILFQLYAQLLPVMELPHEESKHHLQIYVQVHNVQCLGYNGYAANLYTTFIITDVVVLPPLTPPKPYQCHVFESLNLEHFPPPYDISEDAQVQQNSYERMYFHDLIHTNIYSEGSLGPNWILDEMSKVASDHLWNVIKDPCRRKLSTKRNVYIEFFTRPKYCIANKSRLEFPSGAACIPVIHLPYPISIRDIQKYSFQAIAEHLQRVDVGTSSSMKIGWTGTKQFVGPEMYELFVLQQSNILQRNYDSKQQLMLTFGRCCIENVENNDRKSVSISDGVVTLPIVFLDDDTARLGTHASFIDDALAWVAIQGVTVSCICLGEIPTENKVPENDGMALPQYDRADDKPTEGACGICVVSGRLFMVSVYIIGDRMYTIGHDGTEFKRKVMARFNRSSEISVEQCLNPTLWSERTMSSTSVLALFKRGINRLGKVKSNVYSDFIIALAHIPLEGSDQMLKVKSTLQCLDFKPTITLDPLKWSSLQCHINTLLDMNISVSEERLTLGVVWWKRACCPMTCALQGGGWDEWVPNSRKHKTFGVIVRIPSSFIYRDATRGYTRIRGSIDQLDSCVRLLDHTDYNGALDLTATNMWFDFIGSSGKLLPGKLDHRSRRRKIDGVSCGECLTYARSAASGIPRHTLSDLAALACFDLKSTTGRSHLAPSLTREIRDANFLGINYCRARAECSQCYEPLFKPETQIYERVPLLLDRNHDEHDHKLVLSERNTTILRCPNGCRVDATGNIKWECSGIIDDGTGQAKLYAEREAAVCLLGLSTTTLEHIERAIWESNRADGYIYLKTTPPPSHLRAVVLTARAMAQRNIQQMPGKDVRHWNDADVVQFMSVGDYGEYAFHTHCRTSYEPLRSLTYMVRCKPLSDANITLNQTEVDRVTTKPTSHPPNSDGMQSIPTTTVPVQSYSLPPINLNLVDCCCPSSTQIL